MQMTVTSSLNQTT
ncbi:hypothetical protein QZH41_008772, partial [Actinostola sp. cb2023]